LPAANTRTCAGQLRRHVEHGLAVVHQPVGDVFADPTAALDRPHPIRETTAFGKHVAVAEPVGAEPGLAQHHAPVVDDLNRRRPLVRVHSDDHAHGVPPGSSR